MFQIELFSCQAHHDRDALIEAGERGTPLTFHQHPGRVFEQLLDVNQELCRLLSIHDAVVIAECHIDHRGDDSLLAIERSSLNAASIA